MIFCVAVIVGCKDTKTSCPRWGKAGYCNTDKYEVYMKRECCKTCQSTGKFLKSIKYGKNVLARELSFFRCHIMSLPALTVSCKGSH